MSKASLALALARQRPNLLLPALLLLLGLLYATNQFLVSDPADGGSGIGGTGKFGESGIGGTGGPIKFGALDPREDDSEEAAGDTSGRNPAAAAQPLAAARVEVDTLRLTPAKPPLVPAPQRLEPAAGSARAELAGTLARIDDDSLRPSAEFEALKTVDIDLAGDQREFDDKVRSLIEDDLDSTARAVIVSSTEVTRQLILVQAALQTADVQPAMRRDVLGEAEDERRRLAIPARPERPDRPALPSQRSPSPPRGIPAPPVRPMRI